MEQGAFVAWLKREGEFVHAGEALFSIEGDKATQDIESIDSGFLRIAPNAPQPGDAIRVGDRLGQLISEREIAGTANAAPTETPPPTPPTPPTTTDAAVPPTVPGAVSGAGTAAAVVRPAKPPGIPAPLPQSPSISPRARRIAAELGVAWTHLQGSGRTGRIRERDIRAAHGTHTANTARPEIRSPASDTRRVIAHRMLESARNTAPVTLHTTADATRLVELRRHLKATDHRNAPVPGYLDMMVFLASRALAEHPALNARWVDGKLEAAPESHIGLAVDTDAGLIVPVLRRSRSQSLAHLARQSQDLIARARTRQLTADEVRGGTFTITSLGAFGIDAFTPIINYPEVAVLGIGRIQRTPVVRNEQIVARDVMTLSLTFDHCALDGAPAARFLQSLVALIENPDELSASNTPNLVP